MGKPATHDEIVVLRRIHKTIYEAEYDIGLGVKTPKFLFSSHGTLMPEDLRDMALQGWLAFSERREHFGEPPRLVTIATITAAGRHAAGIISPPRPLKYRYVPEEAEDL